MKHYLLQLTWRCQNDCSYCWVSQTVLKRPGMAHPAERPCADWIAAINRDAVDLVDISGGEPLLLPWLPDLIAGCPNTLFGVSTNGIDLAGAKRLADARLPNVCAINVSYHPESQNRFIGYDARFKASVLELRRAYQSVHSNLVLAGDNAEKSRAMGDWLAGIGVHVDLSPYEESDDLGTLQLGGLVCLGGVNHLNVAPDGSAWPCLTTMRSPYWLETCLGNWIDGTVDIGRKPVPCYLNCVDHYVLEKRHEGGDVWGVQARPAQ